MTIVETDHKAPHQIRLFSRSGGGPVQVGCTCRKQGGNGYVSFGHPASTREAKALFNDLTNHDQSAHPFTTAHLLIER